jgi:hypothetical protein
MDGQNLITTPTPSILKYKTLLFILSQISLILTNYIEKNK